MTIRPGRWLLWTRRRKVTPVSRLITPNAVRRQTFGSVPTWTGFDGLTAGDSMTSEQMRALFGCGLHPLAELGQQQLAGPDLSRPDLQEVARLGVPFKIVDGVVSPFRLEVGRRIAAINSAAGLPSEAPLPAADRARVRTEVAREFFLAAQDREPIESWRDRSRKIPGREHRPLPVMI
jgi:hypothetical protein